MQAGKGMYYIILTSCFSGKGDVRETARRLVTDLKCRVSPVLPRNCHW